VYVNLILSYAAKSYYGTSSSSFYLNQATRPINMNKRHTDRQIDSVSERKKKRNTRCTIKHSKTHGSADGHAHRSNTV